MSWHPFGVRASRAAAITVGALLGIAIGLSIAEGDLASAAALVVVPLAIVFVVPWLPLPSTGTLTWIALIGFSLRAAAAVILYVSSVAMGRLGFVTGDDVGYSRLAWAFVRYLQGDPIPTQVPPYWASDAYLFGTWVYLESLVFAVFGPNVVLAELTNAVLSIGLVLVIADTTRRLFGARAGIVAGTLVALWPSLILWSALTLKDTTVAVLIACVLWAVIQFQQEPRVRWLVMAFAMLLFVESVRQYIYVGLLILVPIAVALTPGLTRRSRLGWSAPASALSVVLLGAALSGPSFSLGGSGSNFLATLEGTRRSMAAGARTAIEQPAPTATPRLVAGTTFIVPDPSPTPAPPGEPPPTLVPPRWGPPATVRVPETAQLVVVPASEPLPSPQIGVVYVRAGDEVVVLAAPRRDDARSSLVRTLAYLPVGYAHALFAPFPWTLTRPIDFLTLPEMLVWWFVLGCAAVTVWHGRRQWRMMAPLVLFVMGVVTLLALAEGNVGTLFRHRAMVIPATALLAAPTLVGLVDRVGHRNMR